MEPDLSEAPQPVLVVVQEAHIQRNAACEMSSIQHGTDSDSIQTTPNYARSTPTTSDTDSHRTLTTAPDPDAEEPVSSERMPGLTGSESPSTGPNGNLPEEPPPYSPPDPKLAHLIYPPPLTHYSNQPPLACQPGASLPAFFQPSFLPPSAYHSYAIYMNGSPVNEDQPPLPKDYLVESLLVTIFCCLMSGLVALMYSYEIRAALARGDIHEAERASQKARLLVMFSLTFGIFLFLGWIVYFVIALCN